MNYYFDESGNWQEPFAEKNRLVIAGLLIKENSVAKELEQTLKLFKVRNNLQQIHATEMNNELREELYKIIYDFVKLDDISVLIHYFNPRLLFGQTMKNSDELYIEIASSLISDMTLGDNDVNIEYDMKFHYAFPQNIIDSFKETKRAEYGSMEKAFVLAESEYQKLKEQITTNISRVLAKNKNGALQNYYNLLCGEKNDHQTEFISTYLWTEFRLKIEKSTFIKERFKDKIKDNTKQKCKDFHLSYQYSEPKIKYQYKHYQSAGVQVIDVISNLVWRYANKPALESSTAIQGIYKHITIKDISHAI